MPVLDAKPIHIHIRIHKAHGIPDNKSLHHPSVDHQIPVVRLGLASQSIPNHIELRAASISVATNESDT